MCIQAGELAATFEVFVQGETSIDRLHGGLGLGLAIVNQIVLSHQGQIEARSAGKNQRAEFIAHSPLLLKQPVLAELKETSLTGDFIRALIVDDNRELNKLMGASMEMLDYKVHLRYSGQEGVAAAESLRPDILLLDIAML